MQIAQYLMYRWEFRMEAVWQHISSGLSSVSGEFWAAICGAIVGSVSGGLITWLLQRQQQKKAIQDRDAGLASSLFVKLYKIDADLGGVKNMMQIAEARAGEMNRPVDFMSLMPTPNPPKGLDIEPAELALLLRIQAGELYKRVVMVEVDHRSTIGLLNVYAERRPILTAQLPDPIRVEGEIVSFEMDDATALRVAPLQQEVNSLVNALRNGAAISADRATGVLLDVATALKHYLPDVNIRHPGRG